MTISEQASVILKVHVQKGKLRQAIDRVDKLGAFTRKAQMEMIIMLCERIEELEALTYKTTNTSTKNA